MFAAHRKRGRVAAAPVLAVAACLASTPGAHAQEATPDRKVRIIEGPAPYPAPESPSTLQGRTRQPNTVVPVAPIPSSGTEDGAFEDLVRNALDEERKRYPGPSSGTDRPSTWNPAPEPGAAPEPAPADPASSAPLAAPPVVEAPVPGPTPEPPAPKPSSEPEPVRPPVRETVPPPAADPPRAAPPRPYTPPSSAVRTPPGERGDGPVRERVRGQADGGPDPILELERPEAFDGHADPSDASQGTAMNGVILSDVTIRSEPNKTAAAVGTAKAGTTVEILECVGWCEIRSGDLRGWIYGTFIDLPDATTPGGR